MRQDIPFRAPGLTDRAQFMYRLPGMLSLYWRLWKDPRVSPLAKLLPALALAYIAFPMDFVIDWLPALGQLDDAAVALLALRAFVRMAPAEIVEEHAAAAGLRSGRI